MSKLVKLFCPYNVPVPVQPLLDLLTRRFPGNALDKTINIEGELVELDDAALFIKDTIRHHDRIPLITNGSERLMVELSGFALKKPFGYAGADVWYILLDISDKVQPAVPYIDFMEELITLLQPYWATANDDNADGYAAMQLQPIGFETATNIGLPRLMPPESYSGPFIPSNIAWINYWSKATVEHIRVNYNTLKDQVFAVKQTADAGLLFQLTQNVFNIEKPEDLQLLISMFDAYPDVGGRLIH
jgi:hypothetical protein